MENPKRETFHNLGIRIRFSLLYSFTFAALAFFHNYALLLFFVTLTLLPIASILLTRYASRRVTVRIPNTWHMVEKNQTIHVNIEVNNPLMIPLPTCTLTFRISNRFYPNSETRFLSYPIYAKESQTISLPVTSYYSGMVNVCLVTHAIWDYLHFHAVKTPLNQNVDVFVAPNRLPVFLDEDVEAYGNEAQGEKQGKGEDATEVKNIREYQIGDRPQSIHWKLSSKRDALLVKEQDVLSSQGQTLLFELYKDESFLLDAILDLTYSLALDLVSMHAEWKLTWWSETVHAFKEMEIRSEEDLWNSFRDLSYESTYPNPHYAYELFLQQETGIRGYLYVSKANETLPGKELARDGSGISAILVCD